MLAVDAAELDRFARWFYEPATGPTVLWRQLLRVARANLNDGSLAHDVVADVIKSLLQRLATGSAELLPLPSKKGPIEDERDFEDLRRYLARSVEYAAQRRSVGDGMRAPTVDEHAWEAMLDEPEVGLTWGYRSHIQDPTSGPALDTIANASALKAWARALALVRQTIVTDHGLAPEADRPAIVGYLESLCAAVGVAGGWMQLLGTDDGISILARARASAVTLMPPGRNDNRSFETAFHHAFWRTCGGLVHRPGVVLQTPQLLDNLAAFTDVDIFEVMREHHRGMMTAAPRGFSFRARRSAAVPNRALILYGRMGWWDNLVRFVYPGAVVLPPPTAYVLESSEA